MLVPLEQLSYTIQTYSIIHLGLWIAKHTVLSDERSQIVRQHVRSGHTDRFIYCQADDCARLQNEASPTQLAQ